MVAVPLSSFLTALPSAPHALSWLAVFLSPFPMPVHSPSCLLCPYPHCCPCSCLHCCALSLSCAVAVAIALSPHPLFAQGNPFPLPCAHTYAPPCLHPHTLPFPLPLLHTHTLVHTLSHSPSHVCHLPHALHLGHPPSPMHDLPLPSALSLSCAVTVTTPPMRHLPCRLQRALCLSCADVPNS
jgi:hypothetical protein